MKKKTLVNESIPLIEDLCSGYNTEIGDNDREEYLTAIKCIMELLHNCGVLVELYRSTEGDYLTRFRILFDSCGKPAEIEKACAIFSHDQYLCSQREETKPITQPTTVFRRSMYML